MTGAERFCAWLHRYRWTLLAVWIAHATTLHLLIIGFPSWDALSYRLPPVVELLQHGDLGRERYSDWALHGFIPFAELAQLPLLYALGLVGLLLSDPLVVFPLCVVAVYKLGKQLTGSVHGGNFSALAYAAVPMVNQQPFTGYIDFIVRWGVWSGGTDPVLSIPVPATGVELLLHLDWFSAVPGMNVRVDVAGEIHKVTLDPGPRRDTFIVKPTTESTLVVRFHLDRVSHSADGRLLGIGLGRVRLRVR